MTAAGFEIQVPALDMVSDIKQKWSFMKDQCGTYILTLLRHGESQGNADGIWQGHYDSPLTDLGRSQARALATRWKTERRAFDAIITSPLSRAYETARIIADEMEYAVEADQILMERDNGALSGTSRSERMTSLLPNNIYEPLGETGESAVEVHQRGSDALQRIVARPPGFYLIVSHGGLLNNMMLALLGMSPRPIQGGVRFAFGNTGFATVEFRSDENLWLIRGINDQHHLGDETHFSIWQG